MLVGPGRRGMGAWARLGCGGRGRSFGRWGAWPRDAWRKSELSEFSRFAGEVRRADPFGLWLPAAYLVLDDVEQGLLGVDVELAVDVGDVGFDRRVRHAQLGADVPGGPSAGQ